MHNLLKRENLPYVPLAAIGLAIGIVEYVIHPWVEDTAQHVGQTVMARIEYYRSEDGNNTNT